MSYIQITTKCNMTCDHCCFACTENGEDMTMETWENVKEKILNGEEQICIGGGEPTLHPQFRTILMDCIADIYSVNIVTNGSITKEALLLAKLTKNNIIHADLSIDNFHDLSIVDNEVVFAFEQLSATRTVTDISPIGRALDTGVDTGKPGCAGGGLIVKPNGDVFQCNCKDATCFGNVNDENFTLEGLNNLDMCMRDIEAMLADE